jgi:Ser/Thr protein kinase RdoA (MazF antagonist)
MKTDAKLAEQIIRDLYGIRGKAVHLPGEVDLNFRIDADTECYLLKVSRPDSDPKYLEYQQAILLHLAQGGQDIKSPVPLPDTQGRLISQYTDDSGRVRKVRLLTWVEGRLWSSVHPVRMDPGIHPSAFPGQAGYPFPFPGSV